MLTIVFPITSHIAPASAVIDGQYALSLVTSNSIELTLNPSTAGALSVAKHTVTGSTSSPSGYKLYISTADNTNEIKLNENNIIYSTTATYNNPAALSLGNNNAVWGYAIPGKSSFSSAASYEDSDSPDFGTAKFAAVPTINNEQPIDTQATATTGSGHTTEIYYGVKATLGLSAGNYQGVIRYLSVTDISSASAGEATITPNELTPGYAATTATITTSLKTDLNLGSNPLNVSIIGQGTSTTTTCSNPTITTQSPLTFTCTIPAGLAVGTYNIEVTVNKLSKTYTIAGGLIVKQPYTWEKYSANATTMYDWDIYNVTSSTVKEKDAGTTGVSSNRTSSTAFYVGTCSAATINSSSQFSLSQTTSIARSTTGATNIKGKCMTGSGTTAPTYSTSSGTKTGAYLYEVTNATYSSSTLRLTLTRYAVTTRTVYEQGSTKTGTISDTSSTAYPSNGANSDNTAWYVSTGSHQVYSKGTTDYGTVTGTTINDYPCYGYQGGYWYMRTAPTTCLVLEYNANGGSGVPEVATYDQGETQASSHAFTINASNIPAKSGYDFKGYATSSSATTPTYAYNGSTFSPGTITVSSSNNPVTLYAVWEKLKVTFDQAFANAGKTKQNNYYKMQDMTSGICSTVSTPTTTTEDISIQLIDTRDSKIYWVNKLLDGNCWMTQNLDLDLSSSKKLTSADTNITSGWTPASTATTVVKTNLSSSNWATSSDYTHPYSFDGGNAYLPDGLLSSSCLNKDITTCSGVGTLDLTNSTAVKDNVNAHYHVGNLYTWTAAIAMNDSSSYSSSTASNYDNSPQTSICPKGWRLPNGAANGDFKALNDAYGSNTSNDNTLRAEPLFFARSGYVNTGSFGSVGSLGHYWSSTVNSSIYAYSLYFYSSGVNPADYYSRYRGYAVRCVAE